MDHALIKAFNMYVQPLFERRSFSLVPIRKDIDDSIIPTAYRQLYMLNTVSKLLEKMLTGETGEMHRGRSRRGYSTKMELDVSPWTIPPAVSLPVIVIFQ